MIIGIIIAIIGSASAALFTWLTTRSVTKRTRDAAMVEQDRLRVVDIMNRQKTDLDDAYARCDKLQAEVDRLRRLADGQSPDK